MRESERRKKARALLHRSGYKTGGHIHSDEAEDKKMVAKGVHEHESNMHKGKKKTKLKLKDGGHADGHKAHYRADRLARGGKPKGKGHVTVNVINAHGGGQHPPMPRPIPVPVGAGAGPGPMAAPPGPGAGPMPPGPMNRGGRARSKGGKASASQRDKKGGMPAGHFKKGGHVKGYPIKDGAGGGEGRLQKAKAYGA